MTVGLIIIIIIIIKNECHSNIIVDRLQGCSLQFKALVCNVPAGKLVRKLLQIR